MCNEVKPHVLVAASLVALRTTSNSLTRVGIDVVGECDSSAEGYPEAIETELAGTFLTEVV